MDEQIQEMAEDESFDEGFELGSDEGEEAQAPEKKPDSGQGNLPFDTQSGEGVSVQESALPMEQAAQEPPAPVPGQSGEPAMLAETPDEIKDELGKLKQLNPEAARLAMEDSEDGRAIRSRLENFGAEVAQDRAEATLERRQRKQAADEQMRARIEAHNRNFMDYMMRNAPEDYLRMMTDPKRQAERTKYQQGIYEWIGTKPYKEAKRLMEVAQGGQDPAQVCDLLKQYERERRGGRPDPTGAFAVPSRGAPAAQTGIGDMDDFDAGWDMNRD